MYQSNYKNIKDIEFIVMMESFKIAQAKIIKDGQVNMMSGYQLIVLVYRCKLLIEYLLNRFCKYNGNIGKRRWPRSYLSKQVRVIAKR